MLLFKMLKNFYLRNLSASINVNMAFHEHFEEQNWKTPRLKTLRSLPCLHTNILKSYSLLLDYININFDHGNYKRIATRRKATENIPMYSVT